jgi:hypothetical protein
VGRSSDWIAISGRIRDIIDLQGQVETIAAEFPEALIGTEIQMTKAVIPPLEWVSRCQSTILDERCPFSKERAWSLCLGAVVDTLLESSHLLAHVGGTAQPERLGGPSLGLVGFAM